MVKTGETIDLAPKNWREQLFALLPLVMHGDSTGRAFAVKELERMAEIADRYVASVKERR